MLDSGLFGMRSDEEHPFSYQMVQGGGERLGVWAVVARQRGVLCLD